jgi:arginyl-tRNA synthetase
MNLLKLLQERFATALGGIVADPGPYLSMVKPAQDARFGDYQANCAMSLAKVLGKKPRDVAQEIVARLPQDDLLEPPEIAGPGFINLRFRTEWLALQMQQLGRDDRLGVELAETPRTFVIDFSSPNVAKPMHVGHLRSTIIGDSLARLLRFLGHKVITDNHLGDWGLQFGMLLYGYKHMRDEAALQANPVREMVRLYLEARKQICAAESVDGDPETEKNYAPDELARSRVALAHVRQETRLLHAGDQENVQLWQRFMPWCMDEIQPLYRRLDIEFDHTLGESFYQSMLAEVLQDLVNAGIAGESGGAIAIILEGDSAAVVRTAHGTFTYTTTDLATIRYRMETFHPNAILYVVDFRQAFHFKNLFEAARRWGYDRVEFQHVSFGSVLGPDRRPLRTREGGGVELSELLDESLRHAERVYQRICQERRERNEEVPELTAEELREVYEAVGYGAVKYADLSQNRESDYLFNWEKMLATDGNTATYMQYAYARNRSIFRKGEEDPFLLRKQPPPVYLESPHERALALEILRFSEALTGGAGDYRPNLITSYLWELANKFSSFYQNCSVLKAETPALRQSRLLLCDLTARVLQKALNLLGIRTIERM